MVEDDKVLKKVECCLVMKLMKKKRKKIKDKTAARRKATGTKLVKTTMCKPNTALAATRTVATAGATPVKKSKIGNSRQSSTINRNSLNSHTSITCDIKYPSTKN